MLPKTYLYTSPGADLDAFGRGIPSPELILGLQALNPMITEEKRISGVWWPGKSLGISCLWVGRDARRKKLTAFTHGIIPEFTQMADEGNAILSLGWRDIFSTVMSRGVATKEQLEEKFRVTLEYGGTDEYCKQCRRENVRILATSASGKCDAHDAIPKRIQAQNNHAAEVKAREEWQPGLRSLAC